MTRRFEAEKRLGELARARGRRLDQPMVEVVGAEMKAFVREWIGVPDFVCLPQRSARPLAAAIADPPSRRSG